MNPNDHRILVLALGNDILGDDGVAFAAARLLQKEAEEGVKIIESAETGLALLDVMQGYHCALLLDAILTGGSPPGSILEYTPRHFHKVVASCPHFAGLPEILQAAERLRIPFPRAISILAMEVEDPFTFRTELSPSVAQALPAYVERARQILEAWRPRCTSTRS